jgi:hypothetical protein
LKCFHFIFLQFPNVVKLLRQMIATLDTSQSSRKKNNDPKLNLLNIFTYALEIKLN